MKKWGDVFSGTGTVFISLLSCAACPLCLPIYAGLLSLIGIELAEVHEFFFPIMMIFALLTIGFMAYQIYHHHGKWSPLALATAAAIGMASSAFMGYEYLLYACLALFMGSVFWNKKNLVHKGHGCC
ncbi:MerC domain-containing protein [Kamptonema cortianum]|jgi:hypothetical protein|nr:MerC domain-containing protein [Geitlerinema splendidum]MDK3157752.1 MerC domain-containing protein [Kamptonema cortianum]